METKDLMLSLRGPTLQLWKWAPIFSNPWDQADRSKIRILAELKGMFRKLELLQSKLLSIDSLFAPLLKMLAWLLKNVKPNQ